jgi:hypothetical protein
MADAVFRKMYELMARRGAAVRIPPCDTQEEFLARRARILDKIHRAIACASDAFRTALSCVHDFDRGCVKMIRTGADEYAMFIYLGEWCERLQRLYAEFPSEAEYSEPI